MGERIGLSDEEWKIIGTLLPPERGRGCRPAQDNRLYFEGMMWIARTGSQWRHLPDEYGKWNSVFRRYRRWVTTGMFDAMLETLAEMVERDASADMIEALLADKGYDADVIREELAKAEVEAVIPAKSNRREPIPHDREKYRWRNLVERLFNKLKNWRRIATRYDKTKKSYLGFVSIASALLWIPFVHKT